MKVTLRNDAIRAENGAMNHYVGDITMDTPWPGLRSLWVSLFSQESLFRPCFRGSGQVYLDSSLGGFHTMDLHEGDTWIVENGAYWTSDDEINISIRRERFMTAFWAGEGFFWYQTQLRGTGKVVLVTKGPVEEMTLNNERLVVDGRMVLARTDGIRFSVTRPTRSLLGYWLSGQTLSNVYQGTGRLLISTTPYWRYAMKTKDSP
ncbi:AIM24 family protein [bacterium]|nr:AIM24 family protein [bacterium]